MPKGNNNVGMLKALDKMSKKLFESNIASHKYMCSFINNFAHMLKFTINISMKFGIASKTPL